MSQTSSENALSSFCGKAVIAGSQAVGVARLVGGRVADGGRGSLACGSRCDPFPSNRAW